MGVQLSGASGDGLPRPEIQEMDRGLGLVKQIPEGRPVSAQRLAGESAGPEAAHLLPSAREQVSGQTGDRPAI